MPRLALVSFAPLLVGCRPAALPAWLDARQRCGLGIGEHPVDAVVEGAPVLELGPACAEELGDQLSLDWQSFGTEAGGLDEAPLALVALLHGAHLLVAADLGEVGTLLESPYAPEWARQALARQADRGGLSRRDPAGALLWDHLRQELREIRYEPELRDYGAAYQRGSMVLGEVESFEDQPPLWLASVLMHEASHGVGPAHGPCPDRDDDACDPDLQGVYGAQAWMIEAWRQGLQPDQEYVAQACAGSVSDLMVICGMVTDDEGSPLCDPAARWQRCEELGQE